MAKIIIDSESDDGEIIGITVTSDTENVDWAIEAHGYDLEVVDWHIGDE